MQRYLGRFSAALDLEGFSFDEQTLSVDMVVARYLPSEVPSEVVCVRNEGLSGIGELVTNGSGARSHSWRPACWRSS